MFTYLDVNIRKKNTLRLQGIDILHFGVYTGLGVPVLKGLLPSLPAGLREPLLPISPFEFLVALKPFGFFPAGSPAFFAMTLKYWLNKTTK